MLRWTSGGGFAGTPASEALNRRSDRSRLSPREQAHRSTPPGYLSQSASWSGPCQCGVAYQRTRCAEMGESMMSPWRVPRRSASGSCARQNRCLPGRQTFRSPRRRVKPWSARRPGRRCRRTGNEGREDRAPHCARGRASDATRVDQTVAYGRIVEDEEARRGRVHRQEPAGRRRKSQSL